MKVSPIQLDPILLRYLSDIEFEYDRQQRPDLIWSDEQQGRKRNQLLIDRFEGHEKITHETESRFEEFIKYLESKKALRFLSYEDYWHKHYKKSDDIPLRTYDLKDPYKHVWFEKQIFVEIKDIDFIRKFRKNYSNTFDSETLQKLVNDNGRILYMNDSGQFFYGKNRDDVSAAMEEYSNYYKILVGIYLSTNASGHTTVYKINQRITKEYGGKTYGLKQMQNSLQQIRKFFNTELPSGGDMFEWKKDQLFFNNPKFDPTS